MKIEIFIPYYGQFEYFSEAVRSAAAQSDDDWTLTVVDDAYPGVEAENFIRALSDSRITYLRNPVRLGITRNFNRCVELASADHCVILGSDDRLATNFVSLAKEMIALYPDSDIYQVGVQVIDETGTPCNPLPDRVKSLIRPKSSRFVLAGQSALESLLLGNWLYFPSIIWNSAVIKKLKFDDSFSTAQDLKLIFEILVSQGKLAYCSEIAFQYRRHSGSVSSKAGATGLRFQEERIILKSIHPQLRALGWSRAEVRAKIRLIHRLAACLQLPILLIRGDVAGTMGLLKVIFL